MPYRSDAAGQPELQINPQNGRPAEKRLEDGGRSGGKVRIPSACPRSTLPESGLKSFRHQEIGHHASKHTS
jgi:hypothetical protein